MDDQGWRIATDHYSKLTTVGTWRSGIRFRLNPGATRNPRGMGRYAVYYTADDIRAVVVHAASRHVTVLPKIEMPAHSCAALAAYPELSCTGGSYGRLYEGRVGRGVAGREEVFGFLEAGLTQILELFPGQCIHIGGDEVSKENWKNCPMCQDRIRAEGLRDEDELQSWFLWRIEQFLNELGSRLIGWDEILEGFLPPHATVMSWRGGGGNGGVAAATAGHAVVMTPSTRCYLTSTKPPHLPAESG